MSEGNIKIGVCQNGSCSSMGSTMLLRDIEEYCGKHAEVCAGTCLNRCGKGPNVEITADGEVKIVEGVKSFKRMEKMILENVDDCELEGPRRKVAQLKFDSRRQETTEGKLGKIAEAFEALGGEQRAIDKNVKQSSQLLVLRSRALLKSETEKALADAEASVRLRASQPQPYIVLAEALAQLKRHHEAQQAMQQAMELTPAVFEKKELKKRLAEIEKRSKHEDSQAPAAAAPPPRKSVKDSSKDSSPRAGNVTPKKGASEARSSKAPGKPAADAAAAPKERPPKGSDAGKAPAAKQPRAKARAAAEGAGAQAGPPQEDITMRMWGEEGIKETTPLTEDEQAKTLYARMGGDETMQKLVYGVYDLMRADPVMSAFFERFAKTPETFLRLKVRTVDYFGGEWGGPSYEGPNLFEAHASMAIDDELYDGMMRCYVEMLKRVNMGPQETKEILESVEAMRPPIVDPDGIFQAEMEKKLRKAAVQRQERMRLYKEQKKREEEEKAAKAKQKQRAGADPKSGKAKKEPHGRDAAARPGNADPPQQGPWRRPQPPRQPPRRRPPAPTRPPRTPAAGPEASRPASAPPSAGPAASCTFRPRAKALTARHHALIALAAPRFRHESRRGATAPGRFRASAAPRRREGARRVRQALARWIRLKGVRPVVFCRACARLKL